MIENILAYDTLYSTNETAIVFCGRRENADSLDRKIRELNQRLRAQYFLSPNLGIEEVSETLGPLSQTGIPGDIAVKAYKLDLNLLPKNIRQVARVQLRKELEDYRKGRNADVKNNFFIFYEAENGFIAEEEMPRVRDSIQLKYKGNAELRRSEMQFYVQASLYKMSESRPTNIFVFPRETK